MRRVSIQLPKHTLRLAKDSPSSPFMVLMHFGDTPSSVSVYTMIFSIPMTNCNPKFKPYKTISKTPKISRNHKTNKEETNHES